MATLSVLKMGKALKVNQFKDGDILINEKDMGYLYL